MEHHGNSKGTGNRRRNKIRRNEVRQGSKHGNYNILTSALGCLELEPVLLQFFVPQLLTCANQMSQLSLELSPMQRGLTHLKAQVSHALSQGKDAIEMVEAHSASVSHLAAEVQHLKDFHVLVKTMIADLDSRVGQCEAQAAMHQKQQVLLPEKFDSDMGTRFSSIEAKVTESGAKIESSGKLLRDFQESHEALQRALLYDLQHVAAGKVTDQNDFAVARLASIGTSKK